MVYIVSTQWTTIHHFASSSSCTSSSSSSSRTSSLLVALSKYSINGSSSRFGVLRMISVPLEHNESLNDIKLPLRYWNSWSRSTPPPWSNFSPFEYHLRMKKTNWRSLRVRKELRLSDLLFIFSPLSKPVRRDTCNFDRSHLVCCALMSVNVSELQWDGLPQSSLLSMVRTSGHRSDHKERRWTGVISDSPFFDLKCQLEWQIDSHLVWHDPHGRRFGVIEQHRWSTMGIHNRWVKGIRKVPVWWWSCHVRWWIHRSGRRVRDFSAKDHYLFLMESRMGGNGNRVISLGKGSGGLEEAGNLWKIILRVRMRWRSIRCRMRWMRIPVRLMLLAENQWWWLQM